MTKIVGMPEELQYFTVISEDIHGILPFSVKEKELDRKIKEEDQAKRELIDFIRICEHNIGEKIHFIGIEDRDGKIIYRFLFASGGFLEVILDVPLVMKAHFLKVAKAKKFAKALKIIYKLILAESKERDMLIKKIVFDSGENEPSIIAKWVDDNHKIIKKSGVYTFVAILVIVVFELIKAAFELISLNLFNMRTDVISIIGAVIVAFMFEPMKRKTDQIVNKYFIKN